MPKIFPHFTYSSGHLLHRSLADIESLCEEVKQSGHTALKTNIFHFDPSGAEDGAMYMPGFGGGKESPELNVPDHEFVPRLVEQESTNRMRSMIDYVDQKHLDISWSMQIKDILDHDFNG